MVALVMSVVVTMIRKPHAVGRYQTVIKNYAFGLDIVGGGY